VATYNSLTLGKRVTSNQTRATIRYLRYFNRRIPDAALKGLTA